jgi:6-phosphogluconate dehydrogenase
MADAFHIGMVGLGVMGSNLARNFARNGFSVAGFDLNEIKRAAFDLFVEKLPLSSFPNITDFMDALEKPRRIILLVPASVVDSAIEELRGHLSPGDLLIDLGNSFFEDTERRAVQLETNGLRFIGSGVSGGEMGALNGPSIMPGGTPESYALIEPAFAAIAAKVNGEPCVTHIGPRGSGHYVKMVHNGIEYGIMQLIAEAYDLLKRVAGATPDELSRVFKDWNERELNSYLIEITADIFSRTDPQTGKPLVDMILDEAQHKGTGKWASQNAFDLGVPIHTINAAVEARMMSALKAERMAASQHFGGPDSRFEGNRDQFIEQVRRALYAAQLTTYAQGIALMQTASRDYQYDLNIAEIARIWRGGCIIRAGLLEDIRTVYAQQPTLPNMLLADQFREQMIRRQQDWRSVIHTAVDMGVPVSAFASALAYFDSYRSAQLPANLTQAQRDYFGAHTYRRVDQPGVFHTEWEEGQAISG